jgi:hypothetical protein
MVQAVELRLGELDEVCFLRNAELDETMLLLLLRVWFLHPTSKASFGREQLDLLQSTIHLRQLAGFAVESLLLRHYFGYQFHDTRYQSLHNILFISRFRKNSIFLAKILKN